MTSHGKEDQDQRKILGMEDSSMTIEFLRARLLAERSVSQTARQRAEELSERVLELEEQLKIVSLQRKKAEKATAAVLSILENNGRSDASEEFDSGSDQEAIFSDSKCAESADNRDERKPTSSNVKEKENDADTFSSSEIVSSPSTGRSLSWKSGNNHSLQSFDRKKYSDSAWRRSSSFASTGSSSPRRSGKSCRRIRRSNTRSATDELQNTSGGCPSEILPSSANNGTQSLMDSAGDNDAKNQLHFHASEMSENQRKADENDENMERALQHKAQLIGQYEAEEKAQREWEEKYRENNSYAQDSCDPGNYSDVTEERDDMKAFEQSYSAEMINLQNHANQFQEADIRSMNGVTDNVPSTPHIDTGRRKDQNCSKVFTSESASEFAFSKSNGSCPENHGPVPAYSHHQSMSANGSPMHPSEKTIPSSEGSSSQAGQALEGSYEQALVSHNASNNIGSILGALEQAKFSLSQQINDYKSSAETVGHSIPTTRTEDRLDIPPGCPGLFRLPTDFQPEATATASYSGLFSRFSSANYSLENGSDKFSTTPYMEPGSNAITGNRFSSHSTRPITDVGSGVSSQRPVLENTLPKSLPYSTRFDYLNSPSSFGLPFSSKSVYPTYPFCLSTTTTTSQSPSWSPLHESSPTTFSPIVVPKLLSGEEMYLRSLPRNETGTTPSFHVSHYDTHLRPNLYR
ncbi:uncharacterized protein [Nicotiana sylvestris]|uniref:Uncharacterized protein isoform X1 n=3 Tax=Nicotiana TaxID=4085 RepID=A0A1S4B582_TOBAC|nr:PREDICTED: uncharacterized protein LOC104217940 isoform X1 [Nicotiana sylvestris]XP_009766593.1 PREDICTED: uncharacterized protein LOC104217940 isoform X1 [Nicotiana sylvestris]XP_016484014.1 PREDICTED: uncharacterized protein LOC107804607 isoform X1 [Nicotiana tabacum]